jgi:hypothetical protein
MRKNLPLIIGLAIPLLMIAFVAISIYVPSWFANPQYSFIYTVKDNYNMYGDRYFVQNGAIAKETIPYPVSTDSRYPTEKYPETKSYLYIFDIKSKTAKEISLDEAKKLSLINDLVSPDGYKLEQGTNDSGVFELFGGYDRYTSKWYLRNGAMNKEIMLQFPASVSDRYYYYNDNFQFLGWIKK